MKVDVILPIYMGQKWVTEAIESVFTQTYPKWHLTIVDDASPDNTLSYLKDTFRHQAERVSFVRLDLSRRAAGARMEAMRLTSGDLIAFIDQDDRWHPQKLERQIRLFEQKASIQAIHTNVQHINSNGQVISGSADEENKLRSSIPYSTLSCDALTKEMFLRNSIRLVSAIVSRQAFEQVGGFDETFFGGEDWEFWVRFAAFGNRIDHIPDDLVERRIHPSNASKVYLAERIQGAWQALDKTLTAHPELEKIASNRKAFLLRWETKDRLLAGNNKKGRSLAMQLIRIKPYDYRSYLYLVISYLGPLQQPFITRYWQRK